MMAGPDFQKFEKKYANMKPMNKWVFKEEQNGNKVYLEDILYNYGKQQPTEQ